MTMLCLLAIKLVASSPRLQEIAKNSEYAILISEAASKLPEGTSFFVRYVKSRHSVSLSSIRFDGSKKTEPFVVVARSAKKGPLVEVKGKRRIKFKANAKLTQALTKAVVALRKANRLTSPCIFSMRSLRSGFAFHVQRVPVVSGGYTLVVVDERGNVRISPGT